MTAAPRAFSFGENWLAFATDIADAQITEAKRALATLLQSGSLEGSQLSRYRLRQRPVVARGTPDGSGCPLIRRRSAIGGLHGRGSRPLSARRSGLAGRAWLDFGSRLCRTAERLRRGVFVGVLHHTGDMKRAIENAAALVKPDGLFAFALYRKTRLCWAWKAEKRWYSQAASGPRGLPPRSTLPSTVWRCVCVASASPTVCKTIIRAAAAWISTATSTTGWAAIPMSRSARPNWTRHAVSWISTARQQCPSHVMGAVRLRLRRVPVSTARLIACSSNLRCRLLVSRMRR
jgi:hypothetical protein